MANKSSRKHSDYRRVETEVLVAGPPLDLSFKNACSIDELVNIPVTKTRIGRLPKITSKNRFLTSSMWLSNNCLPNVDNLDKLVKNFLQSPSELCWLDISYNKIRKIEDDLIKFRNIKILYLHGNSISDIKFILKLRSLPKLRSLTLHGNPIEQMPCYRRYVVAILPQISNLDFSPIIEVERKRPLPTGFFKTIQVESL